MSNRPYLFVYGTLKRNFDNPYALHLSTHARFIGEGFFKGEMYLCDWYPAAVYNPDSSFHVYGEVYELLNSETVLSLLDDYEEIDADESRSLYLRKTIPIHLNTNLLIDCQVYIFNQSINQLIQISSGVFLKKNNLKL